MATFSREAIVHGIAKALIFGRDDDPGIAPSTQPPNDELESKEEFKQRLIYILGQMMFVSGETAEPGPETTWMIEEIVREQVVEMVSSSFSPYKNKHLLMFPNSLHERPS
jgi:hypothetical protein